MTGIGAALDTRRRASALRRLALALVLALAATPAAAAVAYTYDDLGRLVRVDYGAGNYVTYHYDAAGNRTAIGNASTNAAPTARDDAVTLNENASATFDPRRNDTDPDFDVLAITVKTDGAHGTVAIVGGTALTYTPVTGYHGADTFTYTISDGAGHTAMANVSMSVVNQPPVAVNDTTASTNDAPVTFDPRVNDLDPESDPLTVTAKTDGAHGAVVITGGTTLTYTPVAGYAGADSFSYVISDGQGNTAGANVTVTVTNNHAPVAGNADWNLDLDYTGTPVTPSGDYDVSGDISDPDSDPLTLTAVSTAGPAAVAITGAHTLHYNYGTALSHAQTRTGSITYTIDDGHGLTATATITVNITVTDLSH